MAFGKGSRKNKTRETGKKRKVSNDGIEVTAKRSKTPDSQASSSGSKESSAAPSSAAVCSRHTVMSEEEDAALHGDDAIYVSGDESEAKSSEAELERLQGKWTSPIYAFFGPTPDIGYVGGRCCHVFHCSVKGCKQRIHRFLDKRDASSTSNLCKHAISCWGEASVAAITTLDGIKDARESVTSMKESGSITAAFEKKEKGKVTYSHRQQTKTETKAEIVHWVSESLCPFKIVSNRGFKSLMKTGRPEYYIPSLSTVSRDVRLDFANIRKWMAKMMQEYQENLSFTTDAWTSPNHKAFVAVSVHFEQNGQPICLILDIIEVAKSHSGINLAAVFAKILNEFCIAEKCLGITCDSASNNDTMIDELIDLLPNYPGAANRCRCFLHVVNLIAKSLLKQFKVPKKDVDTVLDAAEQELLELAAGADMKELVTVAERGLGNNEDADDMDGWVNEMNLLSDDESEELRQSIQPVRLVLVKLRKLTFKILHSTTKLLPAWHDYLEEFELQDRIMPRDVSTRWNSTFNMLNFAIDYCKAIDAISGDRDMEVRQFELAESEWKIAIQLQDVLKILKDATLFFSRSTPNLATVIPAMDVIDERLTSDSLNRSKYDASIRASLGLAKKTLNRYYNMTDWSEVYRIAMVLHPRHKLSYFKAANWEDEWIDAAERIVRAEFEHFYANRGLDTDDEESAATEDNASTDVAASPNIFDNIPALAKPRRSELRDELHQYLSTDPEFVDNVLAWWFEKRTMYPHLSRMALDYLTIPATSVDVKCIFSRSRLILSHIRNWLSAQTTRALLCLGSWSLLSMVRDEDVLKVALLQDVEGEEEVELIDSWDAI